MTAEEAIGKIAEILDSQEGDGEKLRLIAAALDELK